jgi:hypothetical protein
MDQFDPKFQKIYAILSVMHRTLQSIFDQKQDGGDLTLILVFSISLEPMDQFNSKFHHIYAIIFCHAKHIKP